MFDCDSVRASPGSRLGLARCEGSWTAQKYAQYVAMGTSRLAIRGFQDRTGAAPVGSTVLRCPDVELRALGPQENPSKFPAALRQRAARPDNSRLCGCSHVVQRREERGRRDESRGPGEAPRAYPSFPLLRYRASQNADSASARAGHEFGRVVSPFERQLERAVRCGAPAAAAVVRVVVVAWALSTWGPRLEQTPT